MTNKVLTYVAIVLVPVLSLGGAIGAAHYGGAAKAAPAATPTATPAATPGTRPPADLVAQLAPQQGVNPGTSLPATGGQWQAILDLRLPAGDWVLQADETIVNVGPPDFARCMIAEDTPTPQDPSGRVSLDQQSTVVGNAGQAVTAAALSETAAVPLKASTTVTLFCDHRSTLPAANLPYVDPGAVLWAHPAAGLRPTTETPR
jgi:hypothetical protein